MVEIQIKYGNSIIPYDIPKNNLGEIVTIPNEPIGVSDEPKEIERALQNPIGSPTLSKFIKADSIVVITQDDHTRGTPGYLMIPPLLNDLNAIGVPDENISLIFASGTHRTVMRETFDRAASLSYRVVSYCWIWRTCMLGIEALFEILAAGGVRHIFGNPGSTELSVNDVLVDDERFDYILGLHELPVMAMADGYALASGGLGVVCVHISPGLGNSMGMLFNAYSSGTPLLLFAGQQDRRLMVREPALVSDMVGVARPWAKWSVEVQRVEDLPTIARRAVQTALTPPTGPVFLSIPVDLQVEDTEGLDMDSERHIMKVGLTGHGFQKGDYRYGNHSPRTQVAVPNYLWERWVDTDIVIGPPV